jgi:hypothetical protein
MTTWPSGNKAVTTTTDAVSDTISGAREDINKTISNVNDIIDIFNIPASPTDNHILKYNASTQKFDVEEDTGTSGTQGKHDMWIPVSTTDGGGIHAQVTDGAITSIGQYQRGVSYVGLTWIHDDTQDRYAQFQVALPKSWNEGSVEIKVYYLTPTSGQTSGNVQWNISAVALGNADAYTNITTAAQWPAGTTITDAVTAAEALHITDAGTISISSVTENDLLFFRIYRLVQAGTDTYGSNTDLLGVKLTFTTNADNDN